MPWVSHIPRRSLTDPQGERRQTVGDTHAPISRQPPHACRLSACRAEAVPATGTQSMRGGGGLPWWSSGEDSTLPMQGAQV